MNKLWSLSFLTLCVILAGLSAAAQCPRVGDFSCGFSLGGQSLIQVLVYETATSTGLSGVTNDGRMVGNYSDTYTESAFVYDHGNWTSFTDPDQLHTTSASGINNYGHVVGNYDGYKNGVYTSFGFLKIGDVYTTLDKPTWRDTRAWGINDDDVIVGDYGEGAIIHGFVYVNGNFTTLEYPGAMQTTITGINNHGDMVGFVNVNYDFFSFLYSNGQFTKLSYPGSTETSAFGINNSGMVVGFRRDDHGNPHGFIWSNGQFRDITVSNHGNHWAIPYGINDLVQVVGVLDNNNRDRLPAPGSSNFRK